MAGPECAPTIRRLQFRYWHLLAFVVALSLVLLFVGNRFIWGKLVQGGTVNLKSVNIHIPTEEQAKAAQERIQNPAFITSILKMAKGDNANAFFKPSDAKISVVRDGSLLMVDFSYRPWQRYRYDWSHFAYVLEQKDSIADGRNQALEQAYRFHLSALNDVDLRSE